MQFLIVSFITSCIVSLILVRFADSHAGISGDHDMTGPQKFHGQPVPRVGGIGILFGVMVGTFWAQRSSAGGDYTLWLLLLSAMPAFLSGLAEDTVRNILPRSRLVLIAVSASLAIWLLGAAIERTDIPGIDYMVFQSFPFAVALTVFAVTGVANAVNIIDGFNGLASMCTLIMLLAVGYVAYQVHDDLIFHGALITCGAIFGFFVWNYPAGLIFLGDGGAYLLGFTLAELNILLLQRNSAVSPIFSLLLCAYPIFETVFTIYRRRVVRGVAAGAPDGIHLHTLIYRRVIRRAFDDGSPRSPIGRNAATSPYLWILCLLSVIPSLLWWDNTPVLTLFLVLFMLSYVLLYWSILKFKTPKWLVIRRR
jgi:UDP-N-acetylmuramyl pentapeptide phosphotransferase/UDP-N-acetylglucosamine-1-phosphate transferase